MSKTKEKPSITVVVPIKIDEDRIKNLLVSAFEGGIGYWARIMEYTYPPGTSRADFKNWGDDKKYTCPGYVEVPLIEGGKVWLHDAEEYDERWITLPAAEKEKWCLTREKIIKGMSTFASLKMGEGGHHFPNFLAENDDAETADVFVQCCLFGEIVYG